MSAYLTAKNSDELAGMISQSIKKAFVESSATLRWLMVRIHPLELERGFVEDERLVRAQ